MREGQGESRGQYCPISSSAATSLPLWLLGESASKGMFCPHS